MHCAIMFPRSIIEQTEHTSIETTELLLSNGMRICYKRTNFLDDQVMVNEKFSAQIQIGMLCNLCKVAERPD